MSVAALEARVGPPSITGRRRRLVIGILCLPVFVVGVDTTVLNVTIPTLAAHLSASIQQLQWVVDAYLLTSAGLMLTMGSLADRVGRRGVLLAGFAVFVAGSVIAVLAHGIPGLIAGRAVMGVGGACIVPSALSIITACSPGARAREGAMSAWAIVNGAGIALGPVVGGLLLSRFWWGSVFLINVPVVLVAVLGVLVIVPRDVERRDSRFDLMGAALSIVGLGLLLVAVIEAPVWGWATTPTVSILIAAAVVLGAFGLWEARCDHPMVDRWFVGRRAFWVPCAVLALLYFALFGALFLVTQYLQSVVGMSPLIAGAAFLPIAVAIALGAIPAPRFGQKAGARTAILVGLGLLVVGWCFGATTGVDSGYSTTLVLMLVGGVGYGITGTLSESTVMGSLPDERLAVGAATNTTALQVAGAIGVAVAGSVVSTIYRARLGGSVTAHLLPAHLQTAIGGGVGSAVAVAGHLPAELGRALQRVAKTSFVAGYGPALLVGVGTLLAAMVLVWWRFPTESEGAAGAEEAAKVAENAEDANSTLESVAATKR